MLFVFHFPFQTRLRTSLCLDSTLLYLCFWRLLIPSFSFMFSKDLSLYFIALVSISVEYHTGFNILKTGQKFNLTVTEQSVSLNVYQVFSITYLQSP